MKLYNTSCPSLYRGKVESNTDPKNLGRCRVRVPSIHGDLNYNVDTLPWARPVAMTPLNASRGSVNLPDVGDIVWVMFEGGNKDYPVYFGGTYSTKDIKIDDNLVDLYIEDGNKISYNRSEKSYTLNVGDKCITISDSGISIIGDTNINGNLSVSGSISAGGTISVGGDSTFNGDMTVSGLLTCGNLYVVGSEWTTGGSLDIYSYDAMSEEELNEILNDIDSNPESFLYQVEKIKALMAAQGVTYNQSGYVTLNINGVDKKVRTDCSGLVSAMVSAYTGQDILMSSYGYVSAESIPGFQKVSTTELKAGDICARNGHVEIYAYRKDGVDYVYSGGSTKSLNSATPTAKGSGSYDVVWRPTS